MCRRKEKRKKKKLKLSRRKCQYNEDNNHNDDVKGSVDENVN